MYGLTPAVAATRLAGARVGVGGSSPVGAEAARLLRSAGVGEVARLRVGEAEGIQFAVVTPADDEVGLLREWNHLALEQGICWLGLRPFDGLIWAIGPLVVPGESACYECSVLRLASHVEYAGDVLLVEGAPSRALAGAALDLVALGVLVQLSLGWVVGRDRSLPGILHVVEARPAIALGRHCVLRVPRCEACSSLERLAPRLPWHEAGTSPGIAA
jgi:bacteriocin biosynthesis cyclodehydratase domain-containing protein